MAVDIRTYRAEDYPACRRLWVQLTEHHRAIYDAPEIGGGDPGAGFDSFLADPRRVESWVATEDSALVGLAGLLVEGTESELEPVIVSNAYRGHGIGRRLTDQVVTEARARGLSSITVRPVARNAAAMSLFHGVGFRTIGHVELFMTLGDSTTVWRREIEIHGEAYDF